jgi:hypothetical protein
MKNMASTFKTDGPGEIIPKIIAKRIEISLVLSYQSALTD